MVENNLKRLEENLEKEKMLLDSLVALCDRQNELLTSSDMEPEVFDDSMEKQDELLKELLVLDENTESIYESLHAESIDMNGAYADTIGKVRQLIGEVRDKTISLQEKEQIKKKNLDVYFESERKNLGLERRSSKAALDYYNSMNRSNVIPPQFMDQKK